MEIMENKLKIKLEVPGGCTTTELTRFDELLRKIKSVPNEETRPRAKAEKKKKKEAGK
jgi:hypothetical protein